ncbi:lysosomal alpha-glucosidase [Mytilus galloprovincialis]|uniref:Lysosomal alpha-glucosidase n=1 Tax=Mytilus galloprovincialis TaxID=29158 RepID=A0A8B6C9R4_MYTGA|nr:lysosomal alpha-glucosidase [Mytilus galloprovincialis]
MYAGYTDEPMILRSIVVYGVLHKPSTVKFNGKAISQFTYDNLHYDPGFLDYDPNLPQYDLGFLSYDPNLPQYDLGFLDYDSNLPQYDLGFLEYDPNLLQYDPGFLDYDPNLPQYDLGFLDYDPNLPQYDLSFLDYDQNFPQYESFFFYYVPNLPPYDPGFLDYDPNFHQNDSGFFAYDLNLPQYDPGFLDYDPNLPPYDPGCFGYDSNFTQYNPRFLNDQNLPHYAPSFLGHDPNLPQYDPCFLDYDPIYHSMIQSSLTMIQIYLPMIQESLTIIQESLTIIQICLALHQVSLTLIQINLGEHRGPMLYNVNWTKFTMWNKDNPPHEKANLYGSHPFYLVMENDGKSHGVFLLNSNAMDVILQPAPAITWRTIGGIIDLYVFMGPTPGEVIQQYTEVIGHSFMPPYWSFGFHLCRWGYKTANETLDVVEKNRQAGIPQDVQWNDIDYMGNKKDFTYSTEFGDMPAMVNTLHNKGMHYIMIMDPGISNKSPGNYGPYDLGIKMDIFIKDSQGKPLIGKVWPGDVVFPDFTNNRSFDYWTQFVKSFHDKVQFDGMWIDMNEISNFVAGSINSCPKNSIEDPPYVPDVAGGSLKFSTICATSQQNLSISYNVHNLYGLTETQATYTALKTVRNKRPFIISRSTYAGQGYYGGHWSGDNFATYHDMAMSIPELLNFNMFGISMIGADICGFQLDTTEELCQRWYQLGAFYPFSRSHNSVGLKPQDPASFSQDLIDSTKTAYMIRYSLLPYLYTLFHKSHMMGETVARPLFFEFPQDKNTYSIDSQFLWGSSLMISPALQKGTTSIGAYFPSGVWYDWYTGGAIRSNGSVVKLAAPANKINLHVRGGSILTLQDPDLTTTLRYDKTLRTKRKKKKKVISSGNEGDTIERRGYHRSDLFWNEGDTINTHTMGKFNMIRFLTSKNTVMNNVMYAGYTDEPMILRSIVVYGVLHKPSTVKFNGVAISQFTYDDNLHVLKAQGIAANILKTFTFQWSFLDYDPNYLSNSGFLDYDPNLPQYAPGFLDCDPNYLSMIQASSTVSKLTSV